jgi:hypothetical protein
MNNLSKFNNKGDYSWVKNPTRSQLAGSVKRAMNSEPFYLGYATHSQVDDVYLHGSLIIKFA